MEFIGTGWSMPDAASDVQAQAHGQAVDVPTSTDVLPDGRQATVIGDVSRYADFNHPQGDNPYGFGGTCGLCSCADVLDQFGSNVTEADVVDHAVASHECLITEDPQTSGGTCAADQVKILHDYGVPARAEQGRSLDDLANDVQQGHGVIIEANAGYLWNDANYFENGHANHAVVVTGVARDTHTGQIQGFYINDSGSGQSAQFVDVNTMNHAWVDTGGQCVVTDAGHGATTAAEGVS